MPVSSCRFVLLAVMSGTLMHAPTSLTYVYMLMVNSVTLASLDILPEDGSTGTETCRRFYGIFVILMCVNMF